MSAQAQAPSQSGTWRMFIAGFLLLAVVKTFLAFKLDLYSDEIFYWLASTEPALGYSDLPFMTALLVRLGSTLADGSALAVRSLFLVMGSAVPFLVYWLAYPITGKQAAQQSALISLCLPLGGFLGLLAVPDVPLIWFGLIALGAFERALRTNSAFFWILTGLSTACGLSTHYRFVLYPLAALGFLFSTRRSREHFRNPYLYLAMMIAAIGLVPMIWFNLNNELSGASFHLVERHPWEFQTSGLLHIFKQAGLVTPPLYVCFLLTLIRLFKEAQRKEDAALLFSVSITNLMVYMLLAPWTDASSTSIHWPLSGYFPLLVAFPDTLIQVGNWIEQRRTVISANGAIRMMLALGFAGTLTGLTGVGSQAFQEQLQPIFGKDVLSNKMAGWKSFGEHTRQVLQSEFSDKRPLLITDNYYTAAQLRFAGFPDKVITLDREKSVRDGRATQLAMWRMDADSIQDYIGQPALYINEDSTLLLADKISFMTEMCSFSQRIRPSTPLSLFEGEKAFSFYVIDKLVMSEPGLTGRAQPCPYPIIAWIDTPDNETVVRGQLTVAGWSYSEDLGIEAVELMLNGETIHSLHYGVPRPVVVSIQGVLSDPNRPNLGFTGTLDSLNVANGTYTLSLRLRNRAGEARNYGERQIVIDN
ncbi:MAG: glycosyltransferase family 39 protein [Pseudomonadota bacterium]|nr:glycosyltransferase family 39 protein [Pseudomonadota bacterium]